MVQKHYSIFHVGTVNVHSAWCFCKINPFRVLTDPRTTLLRAFMSHMCSASRRQASSCPQWAAAWKAVQPSLSRLSTSIPHFNSTLTSRETNITMLGNENYRNNRVKARTHRDEFRPRYSPTFNASWLNKGANVSVHTDAKNATRKIVIF